MVWVNGKCLGFFLWLHHWVAGFGFILSSMILWSCSSEDPGAGLELHWTYEILSGCKTICNNLCENYLFWRWFLQGCGFPCPILGKEGRWGLCAHTRVPAAAQGYNPHQAPSNLHWWNSILVLSFAMDSGMSCYKTSTCLVFRIIFYPCISLDV